MAPRLVLKQSRSSKTITKRLNRSLIVNAKLRSQIALLSQQNKELSIFRNNVLLQKLELEKEINSVRNTNIQLKAMHQAVCKKLSLVEQNLQDYCVPALVTMSAYIPNVLKSVHEMCKIDKFDELCQKGKMEKQIKSVSPMINGMTIIQPAVALSRLDMSTIIESPSPEQSPKRPRSSYTRRSSPHSNLEPYVRLKDVKMLLKNSKAVPTESTYHQLEENLGEGPSSLYSQENQSHHSNNNNSATNSFEHSNTVLNEVATPNTSTFTVSNSISSTNATLNESDVRNRELMYPDESSMLRNITSRKQTKRRSSESSVVSDINNSTVSIRSRRSAARTVNYKEPKLRTKLRRS